MFDEDRFRGRGIKRGIVLVQKRLLDGCVPRVDASSSSPIAGSWKEAATMIERFFRRSERT
jgi:hypothetical protein